MAEPAHQSGWYPDPWKQAELRWHDGADWTGQVHGDVPPPEPAVAPVPPSPSPIQLHGEQPAQPQVASVPRVPAAPALPTAAPTAQPMTSASSGTSGKAIASLVTALIGIPFVPVVLGILALREIGRAGGRLGGRGLAIAGIVLGSLAFVWIAILLAVAIPTFMAQKNAATGTQAKANAKQLVTAVESCAATSPSGSYTGCTGAVIATNTRALEPLLQRCGQPGGGCIQMIGTNGYEVSTMSVGTTPTTFRERHGEDGSIVKTCSGPECATGTW